MSTPEGFCRLSVGGARTYSLTSPAVRAEAIVLRISAFWLHAPRRLVPNKLSRVDGTHRRALNGTHRCNVLGLPAKYSRNKSNHTCAHSNICDSITNWHLTTVHGQDPARLPPAREAFVGARRTDRPSPGHSCERTASPDLQNFMFSESLSDLQ